MLSIRYLNTIISFMVAQGYQSNQIPIFFLEAILAYQQLEPSRKFDWLSCSLQTQMNISIAFYRKSKYTHP